MRIGSTLAALLVLLVIAAPAAAQSPFSPPNDLLALGEGFGDTPDAAQILKPPAPPIKATPLARCGPGSKPEPDIQGRVHARSASDGLWCNLTLISHQRPSGGFKVFDYVDAHGRECGFYDT